MGDFWGVLAKIRVRQTMMARLSLVIALVAADAPPHIQEALRDVKFSGGLADPFTEFLGRFGARPRRWCNAGV